MITAMIPAMIPAMITAMIPAMITDPPRSRPRRPTNALASTLLVAALACGRDPEPSSEPVTLPATEPSPAIVVTPTAIPGLRSLPAALPSLPPIDATPGRLPELMARGVTPRREGRVTWVDVEILRPVVRRSFEASDGAQLLYLAGQGPEPPDLLIRGGEVYTGVLRQLAGGDPGEIFCVAAGAGRLLVVTHAEARTRAWLFGQEGPVRRLDLDLTFAEAPLCTAHLDDAGGFVVEAERRAIWDGARLTYTDAPKPWTHRTRYGTSPACAPACSPHEGAPQTAAIAEHLESVIACVPSFRLVGRWLLATCRDQPDGPIARAPLDRPCCDHQALPASPDRHDAGLTLAGDVVITEGDAVALWPADAATPSPPVPLGDDAILSLGPPALVVRGLAPLVRPSWALQWAPEAAESTLVPPGLFPSRGVRDNETNRREAGNVLSVDAVLAGIDGDLELEIQGGAGIDRRCGRHVWFKWSFTGLTVEPITATSSKKRRPCVPLAMVGAVEAPFGGSVLFGQTTAGHLVMTWRAPTWSPDDRDFDRMVRGPKPPQEPPEVGWIDLGAVGRLELDDPWGDSGAVSIRVGEHRLVVNLGVIFVTPADMTPLRLDWEASLLGARGDRVVICTPRCKEVDPGLGRPIRGALLDSAGRLLVVDQDGTHGVLDADTPGTTRLDDPPLVATIYKHLERRARTQKDFDDAIEAWRERADAVLAAAE